jgi:hypothetical protein
MFDRFRMKYLYIFFTAFIFYFFSWFILFQFSINSLPLQSEDIIPTVFTGVVMVKEQTLYLNNYYEMMITNYPQPDDRSLTPFYLKKIGENYLSAFPILSSILTLPIFILYLPWVTTITWNDIYYLSHLTGAFVVSLCLVLFYYFLKEVLKVSNKINYLVLIAFGLGSLNLSLISQGLWQHGVVQFFTLLGLIFFYKKNYFLMSMFLGFGVLARPTALIVLVVLYFFILVKKEISTKNLFPIILGIIVPLLFFIAYNQIYYKDISNQGYAGQFFDSWTGNFPESFFGIWLSPSKGILVYSPVIIFSLIAIYNGFKKEEYLRISFWVILLHTLVLSKWKHWYGGFGFGYRMISDILPFLVLPLLYLLQNHYLKIKNWFYLLLILSIAIQFSGLVFFDAIWHNAYDNGFKDTTWLWSIENSEAFFNLRRVLVKFGFLERACEVCEPGN